MMTPARTTSDNRGRAAHIDLNRASASSTLCRLVKLSGSTDTSVALADILERECAGDEDGSFAAPTAGSRARAT
jgi:hypothetical protein